jgi:hypothetical protein
MLLVGAAGSAQAKRFGFSTPGRSIYGHDETLGSILDQNRRKWVVELGVGSGAEGNLGISLGYLVNVPQGLELYMGLGTRVGPVVHTTASVRYFLPLLRYRGYVGGGYLLQNATNIELTSHSAYAEVGYKWIVAHTFHVTFAVGMQRIVARSLDDDSPLREPDVNPMLLANQLDQAGDYRGLVALRFSRAF